ncbi:type I-E CRISPR-associated endoribonuclease Cas2 [Nocardia sp. NBC_01503]|nr:type I-E CRISPR-associated endoribonuclease Cas2 [Nocardia sp. NBC_01503]
MHASNSPSRYGSAIMAYSTRSEQRLAFKVHRHEWEPVDIDGVRLMLRPHTGDPSVSRPRSGWSKASRYRKAVQQNVKRRGGEEK